MKISVITVVLNNKSYIEDCINSVLNQSYKNVEYIVIDGGSTDGTVDAIRKYEKSISKWISEPDRGIYDAMNKGIALCSGDYIGMLNADDMFSDNSVLQTIIDEFNFKIIAKRQNYQLFDEVMNYLADLLFNRDPVLKKNQKLTRVMLFYMCWNCDIGETSDAETD